MAFIETIPVRRAAGEVRRMYERTEASLGYVPNYAKIFSHRPHVMAAWSSLIRSISSNLDARRYELVTLAAARALHSSYCMLAHGNILRQQFYSPDQLTVIAQGFTMDDLAPVDQVIMKFAEQIVRDATAIKEADIQQLRDHGLTDAEIFDIAATTAGRCFFSKLLDALGAEPDSAYLRLEEPLQRVLTVGRAISEEHVEHLPEAAAGDNDS